MRDRLPLSLVAFVAVCLTGCWSSAQDRLTYETRWGAHGRPNPPLVRIQAGDDGNLLTSGEFHAQRELSVADALTPELKAQMLEHGWQPNLDGVTAMVTEPVSAPDMTPDADLQRAAWLLGVRSSWWSDKPGKSAAVHYDAAGKKLLVLSVDDQKFLRCYVEENGVVAEYVLLPEE